MFAADAGEGVVHAGIGVDGGVWVGGKGGGDLGLGVGRDEAIGLGDVEH